MLWRSMLFSYPFWSLFGVTGAVYLRNRLLARLRPVAVSTEDIDTEELLLKWQAEFGYNAHGLVSIQPESLAWRDPRGRGGVAYLSIGRTWLAAGDPFARPEDLFTVTAGFLDAARRADRLPVFVPTTARLASLAAKLGLDVVPVGIGPYFDLQNWAPRGDRAKKVRAGVNQARRAGVRVEYANGTEISKAEVDELCRQWLSTRRTVEFRWLFALDPLRFKERKRFFIARDTDNRMIGLLAASPIPLRGGWYLEDVLRYPNAPNGTSDLLIVEAMSALYRSGARLATLGTVPIINLESGHALSRGNHLLLNSVLSGISNNMEGIYNFKGLCRFKMKFVPSWCESEYALFPPGLTHSLRVGTAVARAIAPTGVLQALLRGSWLGN